MISIVLDLDQTLVSTCDKAYDTAEFSFKCCVGIVNVRHGFTKFIRFLSTLHANVYVFSAGSAEYVQEVCSIIFPPGLLKAVYTNTSCISLHDVYQKILPVELQSDMTIVLDDRVDVYSTYPEVSIVRIAPMDASKDKSLEQSIHVLRTRMIELLL